MGKHLVKIGKSLKDEDACDEDLGIEFEQPMDDVRIPGNVQPQTDDEFTTKMIIDLSPVIIRQKKCSDYKSKKSQLTRSTIPSKQEVEEDLVKTEKKYSRTHTGGTTPVGSREPFFNVKDSESAKLHGNKNFVDERHRDRYEVNPDVAGLYLAAKDETGKRMEGPKQPVDDLTIPMIEQEKCTAYKRTKQQVLEDFLKSEKKADSIPEQALILLIICCIGFIVMLGLVFLIIPASSSTDGQTNSISSPSPASFKMRIAVSPGKDHQVFFNFRGEQLRYNFVSHLSDAFQRNKIKFFIDEKEQRGKDLKDLFVRIEESSIALAIFSTRYPESSWCMDELVKMKKLADQGNLIVIPIFFKVEPEDVGKPTGDNEFGKNFWRLAEDSSGDQIKEWKEALESISKIMGLPLGDKSFEADFVKDIVKAVQEVIKAIRLEEDKENHVGKVKDGPFDG